ncbi:MAG TPA: hypothetical protein VI279_02475 [Rhodocyclaceae bacterium]
MKNLTVMIRAELEIPDDWELVEHPSGIQVLKVDGEFVDFDLAPLATKSLDPDAEWSDAHSVVVDKVLDTIVGLEAELELNTRH